LKGKQGAFMGSNVSWRHISTLVIITALLAILVGISEADDHASKATLPSVYAAAVPIYPSVARIANVQGIVRVRVATDGHGVISTSIENQDANPILARAAQENAQTWKFSAGQPIKFTVIYRYVLLAELKDIKSNANNSKVVLRFPTDVEILTQRWPQSSDIHVTVKPAKTQ
jgi:TonB family protein